MTIDILHGTENCIGWWKAGKSRPPAVDTTAMIEALRRIGEPLCVLDLGGRPALGLGGEICLGDGGASPGNGAVPVRGYAPACRLENLGDPSFCADHRIRYPYLAGSMANGISSVKMVEAMGQAGLAGFFGAAGLSIPEVSAAIDRIALTLVDLPFGFNLIHSPTQPNLESELVDLYLRRGIRLVEAAAFIRLTLPVVRYRLHGIHRDPSGRVVAPNRIIAKVSRVEVASRFFSPPPEKLVRELVQRGELNEEQAGMAGEIPMAQDLTAEADSAGHTDNRSLVDLLPTMISLRDRMQSRYGFRDPLRIGAAGGISTPAAAAAAFTMGAAYVMIGSVNQSCVEAGTSAPVRELLARAGQADVAMAPAADMFEMGVKVQVLKRGTMFAMRSARLYEAYRAYDGIEDIPSAERAKMEKEIFRMSFDEVWDETRSYFLRHDPGQVSAAEKDRRHRMALVFRWYLGRASQWANAGDPSRRVDYQIWCGPAMGAFNEWVQGSFLAETSSRRVSTVAINILFGAAVQQRLTVLRSQGAAPPRDASRIEPLEPEHIKEYLP